MRKSRNKLLPLPTKHHLVNLSARLAASSRQVELKVARWPDSLRRSFWCCRLRCAGFQDPRPVKRLLGVPLTATLGTRTTAPSTTTVPTVAPSRGTARQAPSGTTVRNITVGITLLLPLSSLIVALGVWTSFSLPANKLDSKI